MVDYFTSRGQPHRKAMQQPLRRNVGGPTANYGYFQKDTTTPYPGWTSPWPSVGTFDVQEALDELARRDQPLPVDVGGATYKPIGERRSEKVDPYSWVWGPTGGYDYNSLGAGKTPADREADPYYGPNQRIVETGYEVDKDIPQEDLTAGQKYLMATKGLLDPAQQSYTFEGKPYVSEYTLWQDQIRGTPIGTVDARQALVDGESILPSPLEAPELLQQEVSGEQAAAVPIDPEDLVGGSFFSGPNQTGGPAIPGSGFRYSGNVLKGAAGGPFSELRSLNREGADWQKFVGPAMTAVGGSQIPGAGLLGLFAAGLNKLGAYDQFNPATDSNLFADPETGRATWGTTDPGGSGSQRGTLNLYNMLQDLGGRYPNRQVQTPSRRIYPEDAPSYEIPQYANARDLAYIMGQGDRPPQGLYTQQTPLGYQDFGGNVTNQEALNTYNRTGAGALLNEAGAILGPDAGYNETSDLAASMAENLQDQMDYSDQDWGDWI
jgi:hypothetical protein